MSQPEADEPLGIVASGQSDTHTQEDSNSANRDPESQQDGGGGRTVASSSLSARTREDLSIADGNAGNQPEADEPQTATSSSSSTHTQRSSSPASRNWEHRPEDDPLGMAIGDQSNAHTRENSNPASRDPESQRESGGGRMAVSSGPNTHTQEDFTTIDESASSQREAHELQTAPSSSNNTHTQRSGQAHRNQQGRPGDGGPGVAPGGRNDARTQGSADLANRNTKRRQGGDREGKMVSRKHSTRAGGNIGPKNAEALSQLEANNPPMTPSSSNITDSQRSSSPTNSNAGARLQDDLSRGIAGGFLSPNSAHSLNNGKEGLLAGLGTIGDPGRKAYSGNDSSAVVRRRPNGEGQLGVRAPEGDESKSASDNQTWLDPASEVRGTFNRRVGYGIGEGSQGTTHISTTSTSVQRRNTKGNFDGNYGSNNKYGDEYSNIVNEKTIFNGGVINLMGPGRGEEPKTIGRLSTHTHTPTIFSCTNTEKYSPTATRGEELHVPWMVPYCQNPEFKGREDIINKIEGKTNIKGHNRVALWGLGGTGYGHTHHRLQTKMSLTTIISKTQIALQCVYRYQEKRPVFWVHGSSLEEFSEEFRNIGTTQAAIDGEGKDALALVKEWFENARSGEWILVVDNADNERDFDNNRGPIAQYIPRGPKGTLIITTRSRLVATRLGCYVGSAIEVPEMRAEEARQLFLSRYDAQDEKAVKDILSSLCYLPLAVVGAAAYMTETGTMPSGYLRMLKGKDSTRENLLSQEFSDIYREPATGMTESILSTFFITFDQIKKEYREAANLLRLITFMEDHQNIPEDALRRSDLEGMDDELTAQNAIGKLMNFSLVTRTASSVKGLPVYELHRLVQISAEAYFKKHERRDVSIWMDRAEKVGRLASQSRSSSAASSWELAEPPSPSSTIVPLD